MPDVTVTNEADKIGQLPKIKLLNETVRGVFTVVESRLQQKVTATAAEATVEAQAEVEAEAKTEARAVALAHLDSLSSLSHAELEFVQQHAAATRLQAVHRGNVGRQRVLRARSALTSGEPLLVSVSEPDPTAVHISPSLTDDEPIQLLAARPEASGCEKEALGSETEVLGSSEGLGSSSSVHAEGVARI